MKRITPKLLTWLVLAIVLLGMIGAVTTYVTTILYRDIVLDNQRDHSHELLAIMVADAISELEKHAALMADDLNQDKSFRDAIAARDAGKISAHLGEYLQEDAPEVDSAGVLNLSVYDAGFGLLGSAFRRSPGTAIQETICPGLIARAQLRQGAWHRPLSEICFDRDQPRLVVIDALDDSAAAAYLQVVSDPLSVFAGLYSTLGMPVKIEHVNGSPLYTSAGWSGDAEINSVTSEYVLYTGEMKPAIRISALKNVDLLVAQLDRTKIRLLTGVILIIFFALTVALLLVKYSVYKPLKELSYQLKNEWFGKKERAITEITSMDEDVPVSFDALGDLYEKLRDMAIRDPLTGTYNRALFVDRMKHIIAEHRRVPGTAAVLLVDMVRFKYVNDLLGHHIGDLMLKQVVDRMTGVLRESDTLARLGGDEFTVILPDTDGENAIQVAQKIIQSMETEFEVEGHKLSTSVSIGIALMPEHGEDVETLLQHADYAMYTIKNQQPCYAIYDPHTTEQVAAARITLDGALNHDIEHNDLFLVYHPVMDFKTAQVNYMEALVRWRQPDGNIVLPDAFIRVAEQSGLIRKLSEWIIETACHELPVMRKVYPDLRVGINLSMHNLHYYDLTERIGQALERNGLHPESLLLEITETGVMLDPSQVTEILDQLASMGLRLSIDDFGTGYSSLAYLRRLPVHTLKVDKSFVMDMDTDDDNAAIVRATIDLAHNLGLTVTAEGVESRPVHDLLKGMGCDYYQGYYVCEPMDRKTVITWLNNTGGAQQERLTGHQV